MENDASMMRGGKWKRKAPLFRTISGGVLLVLGQVRGAYAQDLGSLSSSFNFLDSGLAALGSFTAFATTLSRGKLECETQWRDLTKPQNRIKKYSEKQYGATILQTGRENDLSYTIVGLNNYLPYMAHLLRYIDHKTNLRGEAVGFQLNVSDYSKIFLHKRNMFIETVGDVLPGLLADHGSDGSIRLLSEDCASQNIVPNGFTQRPGEYLKDAFTIQGTGLTPRNAELLQYSYNIFDAFNRVVSMEWMRGHVLIFMHPKKQSHLLNDCFRKNLNSRDEEDRGVKQLLQDWLDADSRVHLDWTNSKKAVLKSLQVEILMVVEALLTLTLCLAFQLEILSSSMLSRRVMRNFLLWPSGDSYYLAAISSEVEIVKVSPQNSHIYKC